MHRQDGEIHAHAGLHRKRRIQRPAPAGPPPGTKREIISNVAAGGSSQKLQLLSRGSAMSGAPIIIGINQFASPVKAGMTTPKTITSACTVVIWLKKCGSTT